MSVDKALARIEAIIREIEQTQVEAGDQYRQSSDYEALDIVNRIDRRTALGDRASPQLQALVRAKGWNRPRLARKTA